MPQLTLISHLLCPYVQRAAIVLSEKSASFGRRYIDLAHKPDWFLAISPLGKTPVLLVDATPIFESAVICEYLDETIVPRLHPRDALQRARNRGWVEFGSSILNTIASFYSAADEEALMVIRAALATRFQQLEQELGEGPYFSGTDFGMVDAVFGPIFRYFDTFDEISDFEILARLPRARAWRRSLASRPSVQGAVGADYQAKLMDFLRKRNSALSKRILAADRQVRRQTADPITQ